MMPPMVVPCPPMNLVSECTTTSAPYSIGRSRIGVATVLSTISGTPCRCATSASASMSQMLPAGLPTLSQNTARVLSSISASIEGGAAESAQRTGAPRPAEEAGHLRHRHEVAAKLDGVGDRVVERRLAGAGGERLDAAFERGNAALEYCDG